MRTPITERQTTLRFSRLRDLHAFVAGEGLQDHTIDPRRPRLYARLNEGQILRARHRYEAKDISYEERHSTPWTYLLEGLFYLIAPCS